MHDLTPTERTKTLCYLTIPRFCNRARESLHICLIVIILQLFFRLANDLHGRRHPCHNVFFYHLLYISSNYIFICFRRYGYCSRGQGAHRSAHLVREPARCSARTLREGAPTRCGERAHRSAHAVRRASVAPTQCSERAHRSAHGVRQASTPKRPRVE